ncbi:MAG: hypothetical protein JXR48_01305 [Candidatus Delongbacteria bacterium]|nr:hypothetical protein [Candidatus Delongbacteria bacterium]MBN2833581.1 hypothetical protein [Candidatus Delongbacteria bacterium]
MNDDILIKLWKQNSILNEKKIDIVELKKLNKIVNKSSKKLMNYQKSGFAVSTICLILILIGMFENENEYVKIIAFMTIFWLFYSIRFFLNGIKKTQSLDNFDNSVSETVKDRIKFFYKVMLKSKHIMSINSALTAFGLNFMMNVFKEDITIYKILFSIGVYFALYLGSYLIYDINYKTYLEKLEAVEIDLNTGESVNSQKAVKLSKIKLALIIVSLLLIGLLGLIISGID